MAGIMVYIPVGGGREDFERLGLSSLLEPGVAVLPFPVAAGPDGGAGSLIVFDNPSFPSNTPRSYDAATQTWQPAAQDGELPVGRYYVGYVTADPPRPEELQRASLFDGLPVELGDHKVWVIPVSDFMPDLRIRDKLTGNIISVPKPEHRGFVELANEVYQYILSDDFDKSLKNLRIEFPNGYELSLAAIAKNYRVNSDIVDLLALLDRDGIRNAVLTATSILLYEKVVHQKKTESQPVGSN